MKDHKKQQVSATDAAYPCKRGNLSPSVLVGSKEVKDYKKQQVSPTDAAYPCKRGNLSPSVLAKNTETVFFA